MQFMLLSGSFLYLHGQQTPEIDKRTDRREHMGVCAAFRRGAKESLIVRLSYKH
jgi:hypothetical protein